MNVTTFDKQPVLLQLVKKKKKIFLSKIIISFKNNKIIKIIFSEKAL